MVGAAGYIAAWAAREGGSGLYENNPKSDTVIGDFRRFL
jgi:hypothetical protein